MACSVGLQLAAPTDGQQAATVIAAMSAVARMLFGCIVVCFLDVCLSARTFSENSQGLYSLLFLNGGVDGIDDFFPWNQDFADVFFHLGNEVGLRGAA